MAITPPPKKEIQAKDSQVQPVAEPKVDKATKKKQDAFISKGGKPVNENMPAQEQVLKNINVQLLESEIRAISELRDKRPKPRGKKIAISLHDWIVEAVKEKIVRDSKKLS